MHIFVRYICGASVAIVIGAVNARAIDINKSLDGYNCMMIDHRDLGITDEQAFNGDGLPSVFATPSADGRKLGSSGPVVYVAWPLERVEGFVRMIRPNGETGWISDRGMKPMANAAAGAISCRLYQDATGRIRAR